MQKVRHFIFRYPSRLCKGVLVKVKVFQKIDRQTELRKALSLSCKYKTFNQVELYTFANEAAIEVEISVKKMFAGQKTNFEPSLSARPRMWLGEQTYVATKWA